MKSNVAQVCCAEQGITQGMNQYIGIGMANGAFPGRDLYSTDP
jgi:hypothetical protein